MVKDWHTPLKKAPTTATKAPQAVSCTGFSLVCSSQYRPTLPEVILGSQFKIVINDLWANLTKSIPTSKVTILHVVQVFLHHWAIPYCILHALFSKQEVQFVGNFFSSLCRFLVLKKTDHCGLLPTVEGTSRMF